MACNVCGEKAELLIVTLAEGDIEWICYACITKRIALTLAEAIEAAPETA